MALEKIKIERPDWLAEALPEEIDKLKLAQKGILPDVIKGWFIVVSCMRLLRCVYGDDMATVIALRQRVLDDVEQWQNLEAMTPAELKAYLSELRQEAHDGE